MKICELDSFNEAMMLAKYFSKENEVSKIYDCLAKKAGLQSENGFRISIETDNYIAIQIIENNLKKFFEFKNYLLAEDKIQDYKMFEELLVGNFGRYKEYKRLYEKNENCFLKQEGSNFNSTKTKRVLEDFPCNIESYLDKNRSLYCNVNENIVYKIRKFEDKLGYYSLSFDISINTKSFYDVLKYISQAIDFCVNEKANLRIEIVDKIVNYANRNINETKVLDVVKNGKICCLNLNIKIGKYFITNDNFNYNFKKNPILNTEFKRICDLDLLVYELVFILNQFINLAGGQEGLDTLMSA